MPATGQRGLSTGTGLTYGETLVASLRHDAGDGTTATGVTPSHVHHRDVHPDADSHRRQRDTPAQFVVDCAVSDDLGLQSIRFTVVRQSDGARIIDTTTALSGTSASDTETIRGPEQNAQVRGETYDITVTVTDSGGETATVTRTVTVQ